MVRPANRRSADPQVAQKLWNAVNYIRQQKQIPNQERVARYMQREHQTAPEEVETELKHAVDDQLLVAYTAVGFKGSKVGMEQEGYKVPDSDDAEFERGSHDWYCFDCHRPGEVIECDECWRVYHPSCTEEDWSGSKFLCAVCADIKKKPRMKRKELNRLLSYTIGRLKEKAKELHRFGTKEEQPKIDRFSYMYMDLNLMEEKTDNRKYKYLEMFYADARTLLHNTFIVYGNAGDNASLAKIMIRDCKYDLDEIRQCKDCYHYSNAKPKEWFSQPCRPPHKLVYAKQKGFCYWPAKVIKITKEGYDVRFFGGWHQRAILPENSIKPIDAPAKTLGIKKTTGFAKAMQELNKHRDLIERMVADDDEDGDGDTEPETEEQPESQRRFKEDDETEEPPVRKHRKLSDTREATLKHKRSSDPGEPGTKHRKSDSSESGTKHRKTMDSGEISVKSKRFSDSVEPVIKHKKFRKRAREEESMDVISSSNVLPDKSAMTPEDANLVTSSVDNIHSAPRTISTADIGVQTSKKLTHPGKLPHKMTQTDLEVASTTCNCETKYNKIFSDFKEQQAKDHKVDKERALADLEERLRKDFEEDKQQAVSRVMSNIQKEAERARRQAEERCKEQFTEDAKKVTLKHKAEVSATKKKQWCYNCEEEAMYHCCWNTSYCSIKCQQEHWHREHKRMCRRKRN